MNLNLNLTKSLLIFLLLASAFALVSAYISQFVFDYQPCILCLYQRKPFFAAIFLALIALTFFKSEKLQKIALSFCLIFLFINAAIAFYHVGVEQKIFVGPVTCSSNNFDQIDNLEDLKAAMLKTRAVRCDQPEFFFLGITMAAWNLLYCLGLILLSSLLQWKFSAMLKFYKRHSNNQ